MKCRIGLDFTIISALQIRWRMKYITKILTTLCYHVSNPNSVNLVNDGLLLCSGQAKLVQTAGTADITGFLRL